MPQNLLKMNRRKTDLLSLNAKLRSPSPPVYSITISDAVINPSVRYRLVSNDVSKPLKLPEFILFFALLFKFINPFLHDLHMRITN